MAEKLRVALAEEEKKSGLEGQIRRYIIRLQEDGGKKLAVHLAWGMFGSVSILGGLVLSIRVQGPSGDDLIYAPVDSNESSSKSASLGTRISLAVVGLAINFTMSSTVKRHTKETIGRLMAASSALFALGFCSGYAALPK
uniref:Uncharacterized protein n=2 Tax=Amorphochlora amoebiformis TaxID=1561963 RepID=A0A7S0DK68_9EUKA|mmetsp:Transcript_31804/g.51171  ORF Transcript_31804/g.51171 Transcript_31804/m.51171 type:complete len:140 (+) Transcript_31804:301-720(+)